jgi:hypothetical protein
VKIVIISILVLLLTAFLNIQAGHCESTELYLYKTDDESKVLIMQYSGNEWIRLTMVADAKDGSFKPIQTVSIWDDWKLTYFVKLAGILTKTRIDENTKNQYAVLNNLVNYVEDQLKSGYNATINVPELQSVMVIYDVNGMFESPISNDTITRLGKFGYGINNAVGTDILGSVKDGNSSVILDSPFRESFAMSMQHYATKIPKPRNLTQFYVIPIFAILAILVALNFFMFRKMRSLHEEKRKLARDISDMERQIKTTDNKSVKGDKDESAQRDRYCLESALGALRDVHKLLQRPKMTVVDLPINKIQNLLDSIGAKTEGKWLEPAKKRLNEIIRERSVTGETDAGMPNPESFEEFGKINWSNYFAPMVDSLTAKADSTKPSDDVSKQLIDAIGRDVIAMVADAVDREKNVKVSLDTSVESDLKQLLSITGIKELEIKTGQTYNPETHELVVSNDPSLVTDREQKITKIISRGLILPNGKIIKAKVSIQRRV